MLLPLGGEDGLRLGYGCWWKEARDGSVVGLTVIPGFRRMRGGEMVARVGSVVLEVEDTSLLRAKTTRTLFVQAAAEGALTIV